MVIQLGTRISPIARMSTDLFKKSVRPREIRVIRVQVMIFMEAQ